LGLRGIIEVVLYGTLLCGKAQEEGWKMIPEFGSSILLLLKQ